MKPFYEALSHLYSGSRNSDFEQALNAVNKALLFSPA